MYLFCVDFSDNNLLTEQIGDISLYDLPIMDKLLFEHQAVNFVGLSITKAFLTDCDKNIDFSLFDTIAINEKEVFKEIAFIDNSDNFIAFRNDVYFEINRRDLNFSQSEEIVSLKDNNGLIFLIMGSIGQLKRLYNKNITLSQLLKHLDKYSCNYKLVNDSYVKYLHNIKSYQRLLFDILNGKTNYKPPFVAEGVFTDGIIPQGDFSIIPPVFLGESVQVESGSIIGPNTVIYNNSLISENTSIKNSILFENVFVSSGCFVDGAVCCDNASIKRNSAVFSGSVIGADALIGEDMTLGNGSIINKNVKFDKFNYLPFKNRNLISFYNKLQGLSPDKSALLGSAVAVVFKNPKIVVSSDGTPNALSLKLAFMSGLIASGSECLDVGVSFKSQMFFSSKFCDCDYSVFFSGVGGGTDIEIFNAYNQQLSKTEYCNIFDFCNKGEFVYKKTEKCKSIRQIKGLRRMYIREITAFSDDNLSFISDIFCENTILLKTLEEILKICGSQKLECNGLILYMNESGTNANIKYNDTVFLQKDLKRLVFFFMKKEKKPKILETDLFQFLWRYDSVFLILAVLNIIKFTGKQLDILVNEIPSFYTKTDSINIKYTDGEIGEVISSKFDYNHRKGAFNIKCKDGYVKLINDRNNDKIKVIASSESMAVSDELCNLFRGLFLNP